MSLTSTRKPTAWGDVHAYLGTTGAGDAMASSWDDLGALAPDNFSIETVDGTTYELKDINGKLLDTLKQEPTVNIKFGILCPTDETKGKFWTLNETGGAVQVTSLIQNTKMSFRLANPAAVGSETFEAAKCTVAMNLAYDATQGWSGDVTISLLWPDRANAELFQFGTVAAASTSGTV